MTKMLSRRGMLQGSVLGASCAVAGMLASCSTGNPDGTQEGACSPDAQPANISAGEDAAFSDEQLGFAIDPYRCKACGSCIKACREVNALSPSTADRRVLISIEKDGKRLNASTTCMHCAHPSCLAVCPAAAISKENGGVVRVDHERCLGCKYCQEACPYGVPTYNERGMDKCDCCLEAGIALGQTPACVLACPYGALAYGTMRELRALCGEDALPIAQENEPSCLVVRRS